MPKHSAGSRTVVGHCGLCSSACAVRIHLEGERLRRVTPHPGHPDGITCRRSTRAEDIVYASQRLLYPQAGFGPRGRREFRLEPPVSLWLTEHNRGRIQLLRRPGSNRPRFKQRRVEDRYGARYRTQRPDRGVGNQPCQRLSSTAHDRLSSVPAIAAPGLWLSTTGVQKRCVLPEAAGWRFDPGPTGLSPWP